MKKFFVLTIFIFTNLTSCRVFYEAPKGWPLVEPRPLTGTRNFPPPNTDYGKGFRDGCGTALDAVSKGLTTDINFKKVDSEKAVNSSDYDTGWFDGLEQCTYIIDWDVV